MELKRLISHFTYRIEPKAEGGFIARATDPAVPPLEAATREELQQKIQANIASALAAEFPGLKLPVENRELKFDFHIERTPGGGFAIHSADPNAKPIEGATHEEIENRFAEKLVNFVGKRFMPELAQALAERGSGDVKIFVNTTTGLKVNTGSQELSFGATPGAPSIQTDAVKVEDARPGDAGIANADSDIPNAISDRPITPEAGTNWTILRFLLALLVMAVLMYFFLHRH